MDSDGGHGASWTSSQTSVRITNVTIRPITRVEYRWILDQHALHGPSVTVIQVHKAQLQTPILPCDGELMNVPLNVPGQVEPGCL